MAIQLPSPKERNLYLASQVDQSSINLITKSIIDINGDDEYLGKLYSAHDINYIPKPICLYIDSYGGSVYQCLGLLNIMEKSKTPLHTITTGCAMSAGFMIAICGHKRFAYENSTFLYHQVSGGTGGTVKEMEEKIIEVKRLLVSLEEIVLSKTSISEEQIKNIYETKKDWYITSGEALELKIIDKII